MEYNSRTPGHRELRTNVTIIPLDPLNNTGMSRYYPITSMKKQKPGKKSFALGHTASKSQSQNGIPGFCNSKILPRMPHCLSLWFSQDG